MATYTIDFSHVGNNIKNDLLQLTQEERNSISQLSLDNQIMTLTAIEYDKDIAASLPDENVEDLSIELSDVVANNSLSTKYIYNNSIIGRLLLYQNTINANIRDKLTLIDNVQQQLFSDYVIQSNTDIQTLTYDSINIKSSPYNEINTDNKSADVQKVSAIIGTFETVRLFVYEHLKPLLENDFYSQYPLSRRLAENGQIIPSILNQIDLGVQTFMYMPSGKIMFISDILQEIYLFIEQLNNLYLLEVSYVPLSVELSTTIACNITKALAGYKQQDFGEDVPAAITNLQISPDVISPNNVTIARDLIANRDERTNILVTKINEEYESVNETIISKYQINFDNLIKLNTNQQNITDILNEAFTKEVNGQFLFNIKTVKIDNFDVVDAQKLIQAHGLTKGSQITKENILSLLDDIFIRWLKSINIMQVIITYCHCNCHKNTVVIADTHMVIFGCIACGKLTKYDYTQIALPEENTALSITLSTLYGTFDNGQKTVILSAEITDKGNYPNYNEFRIINQGPHGTKLGSIYSQNGYFSNYSHYEYNKKYVYTCNINIDDYYVSYDDAGSITATGPIRSSIDQLSVEKIVLQSFVDENMLLAPYKQYETTYDSILTGNFLIFDLKPKEYKYTFKDSTNTKRKYSISLPYSTILAPAISVRASYSDNAEEHEYAQSIFNNCQALTGLVNFISEGETDDGKQYIGIKLNANDQYPITGEYSFSTDKSLFIDYGVQGYKVTVFWEDDSTITFGNTIDYGYTIEKFRTIKADIQELVEDYIDTTHNWSFDFKKIIKPCWKKDQGSGNIITCNVPKNSEQIYFDLSVTVKADEQEPIAITIAIKNPAVAAISHKIYYNKANAIPTFSEISTAIYSYMTTPPPNGYDWSEHTHTADVEGETDISTHTYTYSYNSIESAPNLTAKIKASTTYTVITNETDSVTAVTPKPTEEPTT